MESQDFCQMESQDFCKLPLCKPSAPLHLVPAREGIWGNGNYLAKTPELFVFFRIIITGKCCCPSILKYNDSMMLVLSLELFCGRHSSKARKEMCCSLR